MSKPTRRNLLKGLAVGAPAVWARPVVDSVLLPVHAGTTSPDDTPVEDAPVCECQGCFQIFGKSAFLAVVNEWFQPTIYSDLDCEFATGSGEIWYVQCPPGTDDDVPDCELALCAGEDGEVFAPFELERNESCAIYFWKLT
jgi:hypothetical protein